MKLIHSVAVACALALFASVNVATAGPGGCCKKAQKADKECTHKCCVDAAKDGKWCEKCGGSGEKKKKEEKRLKKIQSGVEETQGEQPPVNDLP
jgi:hypothetical protein